MADRYPQAGFRGVELFEPGERDFSLGYTTDDGTIHLSARWFAAPIVELKAAGLCNADLPTRAGIEGPAWHGQMLEPEHTLMHEFGHVLMKALQARRDKGLARLLRDGFYNGAVVDPVNAPTGYSVPSKGNEDGGEWFGECFAAAHVGNENLKAHPQVQLMRKFLDAEADTKDEAIKPILCIDFDGTIHNNATEGDFDPARADGPIVPGFWDWVRAVAPKFRLVIYSARSAIPAGERAMRDWLAKRWREEAAADQQPAFEFASEKPQAWASIDDRAIRFAGRWSDPALKPETLLAFRPWNKS